jgi:hypothetical protein
VHPWWSCWSSPRAHHQNSLLVPIVSYIIKGRRKRRAPPRCSRMASMDRRGLEEIPPSQRPSPLAGFHSWQAVRHNGEHRTGCARPTEGQQRCRSDSRMKPAMPDISFRVVYRKPDCAPQLVARFAIFKISRRAQSNQSNGQSSSLSPGSSPTTRRASWGGSYKYRAVAARGCPSRNAHRVR